MYVFSISGVCLLALQMVFRYGTTFRLDLPSFNDDRPSFLCSDLHVRSLLLLGLHYLLLFSDYQVK